MKIALTLGGIAASIALLAVMAVLPAPWWRLDPGPVIDAGLYVNGTEDRVHVLTVTANDLTYGTALVAMTTGKTLLPKPEDVEAELDKQAAATDTSIANARAITKTITGKSGTWEGDAPVVGPSAGLAITLAMIDAARPGDLTAGRSIAASASIDDTGAVGVVGALSDKLSAAKSANVDVVFVAQNSGVTPPVGVSVIEVATVQQAVEWLCQTADDAVCDRIAKATR